MRMSSPTEPADLDLACFSDVHGWGGALTAAQGLSGAARRVGLTHRLLGVGRPDPSAAASQRVNVEVPVVPGLWRIRSWCVSRALARHLRRFQPPRRVFATLSPYWVVAARAAWPAARVVYVFPCLLSNCLPFTWPKRQPPTFWRRVDFAGTRRAEHLALSAADLTLTPTEESRAEILAFHPAARGTVEVCDYGCDAAELPAGVRATQRRALGLPEDAVLFAVAGVCDLNKAFAWAVRELAAVGRRGRLLIVGDGPERAGLERLAQELGVSGRVHLVGAQRDMTPWYAAADVVVSTSHYDTFPNVLLEGMWHGRPALVPRHDPPHVYAGMAGVIATESGGVLYDRRRFGALSDGMNRLLADPRRLAELGRKAQTCVRRRFRWDHCLARVVGLSAGSVGRDPRGHLDAAGEPEPACVL